MDSGNLPDFRSFCEAQFHFSHRAKTVSDQRSNPQIDASVVYQAVFFMGALGLGSLLLCDQTLRTSLGRQWLKHKAFVSDSTMACSLEGMTISKLREMLYDSYRLGVKQGASKCSLRAHKLRLGILDGSSFSQFQASCFEVVAAVSLMLDLEPIPKQGKELPASYALLRRLTTVFGTGFVDLILGDGLYLNAPFVNLCLHEVGCDVLLKTDDTSLIIIQDAMALFAQSQLLGEKIQTVSGVDAQRMCEYQVIMTDGFRMNAIDVPLSVASVVETNLRNAEVARFFVVASNHYLAQALTAEEMRQLAHLRWDVENNGFKELNQKVRTKHLYSHDCNAQQAVLLILFLVFNLLQLYWLSYMARLNPFDGMKQTKKFAVFYLRYILMIIAYFDAG